MGELRDIFRAPNGDEFHCQFFIRPEEDEIKAVLLIEWPWPERNFLGRDAWFREEGLYRVWQEK